MVGNFFSFHFDLLNRQKLDSIQSFACGPGWLDRTWTGVKAACAACGPVPRAVGQPALRV